MSKLRRRFTRATCRMVQSVWLISGSSILEQSLDLDISSGVNKIRQSMCAATEGFESEKTYHRQTRCSQCSPSTNPQLPDLS